MKTRYSANVAGGLTDYAEARPAFTRALGAKQCLARNAEAMREIPQEAASPARALEDRLPVALSANFQDERAVEMQIVEVRRAMPPS